MCERKVLWIIQRCFRRSRCQDCPGRRSPWQMELVRCLLKYLGRCQSALGSSGLGIQPQSRDSKARSPSGPAVCSLPSSFSSIYPHPVLMLVRQLCTSALASLLARLRHSGVRATTVAPWAAHPPPLQNSVSACLDVWCLGWWGGCLGQKMGEWNSVSKQACPVRLQGWG